MIRRSLIPLFAMVAASFGMTAEARSDSTGMLHASPKQTATTLPAGLSRLTSAGYAYRPESLSEPAPLLVLLHGAGGQASLVIDRYKPIADRRGVIVLALQATDVTWHVRPTAKGYADFGPDAEKLDAALAELFSKAAVDRRRIALIGFSDGASYGLSLGLTNPQLFRTIVALSPGYLWVPPNVDRSQRLFIAHGRRDDILPISHVKNEIVPALRAAGLDPHVHWFDGGHSVDKADLDIALDFVLGPAPR
jgi:phospholipase/carboxylesterase